MSTDREKAERDTPGSSGPGTVGTAQDGTVGTAQDEVDQTTPEDATTEQGAAGDASTPASGPGPRRSGKRRPRQGAAAKKPQAAPADTGAEQSPPEAVKPDTAEDDAQTAEVRTDAKAAPAAEVPMSAQDYARTTDDRADHTSVIPIVTDAPAGTSSIEQTDQTGQTASGRQARLRLVHVEPWSVTRLAFVVSVALMIVAVVAVAIFWIVMDITGVWDQLNGSVTNVLSDNSGSFDVTDYLGFGRLVGLTLLLSAINVIVLTALATIGAHLYNLAAQLLGGIQVTFGDD